MTKPKTVKKTIPAQNLPERIDNQNYVIWEKESRQKSAERKKRKKEKQLLAKELSRR